MTGLRRMVFFIAGVIFGTAGVKVLASKDAKKVYVHTTAAALRMKDSLMETVNVLQENASDIVAEAKDINRERTIKSKDEIIEDEFFEEG